MEEFTNYQPKSKYTIRWKLDSTKYSFIDFKGYEAGKNQVKFLSTEAFLRQKQTFYQKSKIL